MTDTLSLSDQNDAYANAVETHIRHFAPAMFANLPWIMHINPGKKDWPEGLHKPPGGLLYIPRLSQEMLDRVPPEQLKDIRAYAKELTEEILKKWAGQGKANAPDDDTTSSKSWAGRSALKLAGTEAEGDTSPRSSKKRKQGLLQKAGTIAAFTAAGLGIGTNSTTSDADNSTNGSVVSHVENADDESKRLGPYSRANSKAAFTLIELLVVIGIIGVLVGILIPVGLHARRVAQDSTFKNNMKQVATAVATFDTDHKGEIPEASSGPEITNSGGFVVPGVQHSFFRDLDSYRGQDALPYDPTLAYNQQPSAVQTAIDPGLHHPRDVNVAGTTGMAAIGSSDPMVSNPIAINSTVITAYYTPNFSTENYQTVIHPQWVSSTGDGTDWQQLAPTLLDKIPDPANTVMIARKSPDGVAPFLNGAPQDTGLKYGGVMNSWALAGGSNTFDKTLLVNNAQVPNNGADDMEKNTVVALDAHVVDLAATGTGANLNTTTAGKWQDSVSTTTGHHDLPKK